MQFSKDCPFQKHFCKACHKVGHKEGYCNCVTPKAKKQDFVKNPKRNTIFSVLQLNGKSLRKFLQVTILGKSIRMQFDTASDITIISKQSWLKLGSPELKPTNHSARSASGNMLSILGELTSTVQFKDVFKNASCFVSENSNLNLFVLDWIELFGLESQPLSSICNCVQSFQTPILLYKEEFPNVFNEHIRLMTFSTYALLWNIFSVPNTVVSRGTPVFQNMVLTQIYFGF